MTEPTQVLVGFNHESVARILINRLERAGIHAYYHYSESYQHGVCLRDEADREKAEAEVQAFLKSPNFEQEQNYAWENEQTVHSSFNFDAAAAIKRMWQAPLTSVVVVLCWLVFLLSYFGFAQAIFNVIQIQPFNVLSQNQQWWRLLSPALFHFDILHILFNVMWWWVLAEKIEQRLGHVSLLVLTLACALMSNISQLLIDGPNFGGLSGVVYGLVGFMGYLTFFKPQWGLVLPKSLLGFFMFWLVLGFTQLLPISIANTAHLTGLIAGVLCGSLLAMLAGDKSKGRDE